jgi:hypothetical protein
MKMVDYVKMAAIDGILKEYRSWPYPNHNRETWTINLLSRLNDIQEKFRDEQHARMYCKLIENDSIVYTQEGLKAGISHYVDFGSDEEWEKFFEELEETNND